MTCSTKICILVTWLVFFTLLKLIYSWPLFPGRICNLIKRAVRLSLVLNYVSACNTSKLSICLGSYTQEVWLCPMLFHCRLEIHMIYENWVHWCQTFTGVMMLIGRPCWGMKFELFWCFNKKQLIFFNEIMASPSIVGFSSCAFVP